MSEDFDPFEHDRVSRSKGYEQERERLCELLKETGDQRIGQLISNAIISSDRFDFSTLDPDEFDEKLHRILWNIETPELVKIIEEYYEEVNE